MQKKFNKIIETKLRARIDGLQVWLDKNGKDCQKQQGHLIEMSIERIYWHYGYMVALMDALRLMEKTKIQQN
jgi:hypothetical protein